MSTAEEFDAFANGLGKPAEVKPPEAPAVEPPAAPVAEPAVPAPAPAPAAEERPRDADGRFVSVAVHAREMGKLKDQVAELTSQLDKVKQTAETPKSIAAFDALREKFQEDFPDEYKQMMGAFEGELLTRDQQMAKMSETLSRYEQSEQQREQQEQQKAADAVNAIIDASPVLSQLQAAATTDEGKAVWDAAVKHSQQLLKMPAWVNKTEAEIYEEAGLRAARDYGIKVESTSPATPSPAPAPSATPAPAPATPKPLPAPTVPGSLSLVPTGQSPEVKGGMQVNSLHAVMNASRNMSREDFERVLLHGG